MIFEKNHFIDFMVYKFYNDYSVKLTNEFESNDEYIGGEDNYQLTTDATINNDRASFEMTNINFDEVQKISSKMQDLCKVLYTITSTFLQLIDNNNSNTYDYKGINDCITDLIDKLTKALDSINTMTTSFKLSLEKIKQSKLESNNPNNERDTKETFQESVKPIRDYLSKLKKNLCDNFNLLVKSVEDVYLTNYNKNHTPSLTVEQFEKGMINDYPFKSAVLDALKKSPLWYVVMDLGIYIPGYEKRLNYLEPIISNSSPMNYNTSIENNPLERCLGFGEDTVKAAINKLEDSLKITLNKIRNGLFVNSYNDIESDNDELYGGDLNGNQYPSNAFDGMPMNISQTTQQSKELARKNIETLNDLTVDFFDRKILCQTIAGNNNN